MFPIESEHISIKRNLLSITFITIFNKKRKTGEREQKRNEFYDVCNACY